MATAANHLYRDGIQLPNDGKDRPIAHAMLSPRRIKDFVLPGLGTRKVGVLVAPGAAGKSFWAMQAAISITTGLDLLDFAGMGHTLKTGKVTYLAMEDDFEDLEDRLHDIYSTFKPLQKQAMMQRIDEDLTVIACGKGDFDLLTMVSGGISLEACATGRRLLILDTLSTSHSAKENDTDEMATVIANAQRLGRQTGCAILMLHHAAKSAVLNGQMEMQQAARGSSVIVDNARAVFFMQTMTDDEATAHGVVNRHSYVRYGSTKLNHGKPVLPFWYEKQKGSGVLVAAHLKAPVKRKKPTGEQHGAGKELSL